MTTTATLALLADLFLKATIVLSIALVFALVLRRRSAGTRHLILSSALIALLALPFTTPALSIFELPLLPGQRASDEVPIRAERLSIRPAAGAAAEASSPEEWTVPTSSPTPAAASAASAAPQPEETSSGVTVPLVSMNSIQSWIWAALTPATVLVAIWLAGAAVLLVHLLTGILRVQWIVERAMPLNDRATLDLVDQISVKLGLERGPDVLISPDLSVPVVWGLASPSLLLPVESEEWSDDRRRAVLLHELAHVKRRDGLTLVLTRISLALYWLNPLTWISAKMARRYCERACDDVVLARGTRASEYADHLLAIARTLPEREQLATVTLAMSRRSEIEGRLLAILHPHLQRSSITRKSTLIAALIASIVVLSVSSFRLTAEETDHGSTTPAQTVETSPVEPDLEIQVAADIDADPDMGDGWDDTDTNTNWSVNSNTNTNWNVNSNTNWNVNSNRNENRTVEIAENDRLHKERGKSRKQQTQEAKLWEKAWNAHQEDRFEESIPLFMKTAELGYRAGASRYNVACGYAMQGNANDAVIWLERAIESGFDDWDLLRDDTDLDPIRSSSRFRSFLGSVEAGSGEKSRSRDRGERVMTRFTALVEAESTDAGEWAETGRLLLGLRMFEPSRIALQNAIRYSGSPAVVSMYNMACLEALRGDSRSAIAWLDKAIESGFDRTDKIIADPDLASIRNTPSFESLVGKSRMLSLDAFNAGKDDEPLPKLRKRWAPAIERYSAYTSANPGSGRGWWNLGWAQHMSAEYETSVKSFERAASLGYRPGNSAYNIACGHALLGHVDLARHWLERAADEGFKLGNRIRWDDDLAALRGNSAAEALFESGNK